MNTDILMDNIFDLSNYQKSAPLKTPEDIRLEWLASRRGKFTASQFYRLVTYPAKKDFPPGALTYVKEKVVECLTEISDDQSWVSPKMQWGMDHELEAISAFTEITGIKVINIGINQKLIALGEHISCTPDGILADLNMGIEVKCPDSKTHFEYMGINTAFLLKEIAPNYYWQIQGSMYITGFDSWVFVSYDPRFKNEADRLHRVMIFRDQSDIDFLESRLLTAIVYKEKMLYERVERNK